MLILTDKRGHDLRLLQGFYNVKKNVLIKTGICSKLKALPFALWS